MKDPQYIEVDGVRTRYYAAGDGEPMILVHGGHFGAGGSAEDWELNFGGLADDFRVYAIDKLGMGFTDNPPTDKDYNLGAQAQHLRGFMGAVGAEHAHLVGHSRGGYAVTRVALDDPEAVRTLSIVSSSSVINPLNPIYDQWRRQAATMDVRDGVYHLHAANSYGTEHITQRWVDVGVEIMELEKTRIAATKMQGEFLAAFKADVLARVDQLKRDVSGGRLSVPTLLAWGADDPSATVERCVKPAIDLYFTAVADCELHLFGRAGHYCYREHPDAFNVVVREFIRLRRWRSGIGNEDG